MFHSTLVQRRRRVATWAGLFGLAVVILMPDLAAAAWPTDPQVNFPVCTATRHQRNPSIVTDGGGGAIVSWADGRGVPMWAIYAQHVMASGEQDPGWPANGRALCAALSGGPTIPELESVADGVGGVIVVWNDFRGGSTSDLYAQHVLSGGVVDPAWPADGRALCTAAYDQRVSAMVTDGAGGAIVLWRDCRSDASGMCLASDVYAQHVLANGAVDPAWPADGLAVCTAPNDQDSHTMVSDGAGGAFVGWSDRRSGTLAEVYVQHVLASGTVDPAWPVNGLAVGTGPYERGPSTMCADGTGGVIVAWADFRSDTFGDLYAQHLLASGAGDPAWPANGVALSTAPDMQSPTGIAPDGAGGAVVIWEHWPAADIYAQHVLASGAVDPAWPVNGRALCTAVNYQYKSTAISDGAGGAIVAWYDNRGTDSDIYAQRVRSSGVVDADWPEDGRALCTAPGSQDRPRIASDAAGGAIACWQDFRNGGSNGDIYAQRVMANGQLGGDVVGVEWRSTPVGRVGVALSPNPARGGGTVSLAVPRDTDIDVALYDVGGREVEFIRRVHVAAGRTTFEWRSSQPHAGVYFLRALGEDFSAVSRVVILR